MVPGGLLPAGASILIPSYTVSCEVTHRGGRVDRTSLQQRGHHSLEQIALWILFAFLLIGPIADAIYLGYRLRRRPAATG